MVRDGARALFLSSFKAELKMHLFNTAFN